MIQTNELRIGNWYKQMTTNIFRQVDLFLFHEIFDDESYLDYLVPIRLTTEVLEKCGFIQHHDNCHNGVIYIKDIFGKPPFIWGVFPQDLGSGIRIKDAKPISYLHQLQNLYFALTGIELEINF